MADPIHRTMAWHDVNPAVNGGFTADRKAAMREYNQIANANREAIAANGGAIPAAGLIPNDWIDAAQGRGPTPTLSAATIISNFNAAHAIMPPTAIHQASNVVVQSQQNLPQNTDDSPTGSSPPMNNSSGNTSPTSDPVKAPFELEGEWDVNLDFIPGFYGIGPPPPLEIRPPPSSRGRSNAVLSRIMNPRAPQFQPTPQWAPLYGCIVDGRPIAAVSQH